MGKFYNIIEDLCVCVGNESLGCLQEQDEIKQFVLFRSTTCLVSTLVSTHFC